MLHAVPATRRIVERETDRQRGNREREREEANPVSCTFAFVVCPPPSTCSVRISDCHLGPNTNQGPNRSQKPVQLATPLSPLNATPLLTTRDCKSCPPLSVCKIFYLHIFLILILHCSSVWFGRLELQSQCGTEKGIQGDRRVVPTLRVFLSCGKWP